jgi:hypothetical protein
MKLGSVGAAILLAGGLAAAQEIDKTKTRVIVEDGKAMTVTGCVQRNADGELTLTNVADKDGRVASYILAAVNDEADELGDLKGKVGQRVEVKGIAADRGEGKIRVKTESEARKADGGTAKTEVKSEVKGDLDGLPFLGVKSARVIAAVCP